MLQFLKIGKSRIALKGIKSMGIFGKSKEEKKLEDCRKLAEETLSVFRNADVESSVASLIIKLMMEKTKVCKNSLYSSVIGSNSL